MTCWKIKKEKSRANLKKIYQPDALSSLIEKSGVVGKKVRKGRRWMPWLSEAMKDVISCEKLGGGANNH